MNAFLLRLQTGRNALVIAVRVALEANAWRYFVLFLSGCRRILLCDWEGVRMQREHVRTCRSARSFLESSPEYLPSPASSSVHPPKPPEKDNDLSSGGLASQEIILSLRFISAPLRYWYEVFSGRVLLVKGYFWACVKDIDLLACRSFNQHFLCS